MNQVLLTILPLFWPKMPPLGLGYLQGYLLKNGIDAEIYDLNNIFYRLAQEDLKKQWLSSCNTSLEDSIFPMIKVSYRKELGVAVEKMLSYNIIGFSCFKSNFRTTLEFARFLKSKQEKIKIILGGPEIARQSFKTNGRFDSQTNEIADLIVVGEGEKPLLDYLRGTNKLGKVLKFDQLDDLAVLGYPRYKGLDFSSYPRKEAVPLQFSRGCIRKCGFCSERLLCRGFRVRKSEDLIEEIKYHKENNNSKYFIFFDSLINGDLSALEKLCNEIVDNFGAVNWEAQIAVRKDMNQGLFEKIKRSGCYNLFIGLESGSDRTLQNMNKGFTAKEASDFFRKLKAAGLFFGVSMIVGYPGESDSDFQESLEFVVNHKGIIPKIEQVNPFTFYEGTSADRAFDYKISQAALQRFKIFTAEIKREGFKYTNAFLGNLVEKNAGI